MKRRWITMVLLAVIIMLPLFGCDKRNLETKADRFEKMDSEINTKPIALESLVVLKRDKTHKAAIYCSDSNEKYVAVGSQDGSISLWDNSGNLLHHKNFFTSFTEEVELHSSIYAIGDERRLIKISYDSFESEMLYEGVVAEFSVNADETLVAISSGNQGVKVLDLKSMAVVSAFDWTDGCFDVRFSPDSKYLFCVGHNGKVQKYEISTGEVVQNYEGLASDVHCLEITKEGAFIVAGAIDQNVAIWDVAGPLIKMYRHSDGLFDVAISLDEQYVSSVGVDRTVVIADLKTGEIKKRMRLFDELHTVTFTQSGLVTGGYDTEIYFLGNQQLE